MVHCIYVGITCYTFQRTLRYCISFSVEKIGFVLASSADPDEMLHYAAFHLGFNCLPKYPFKGFWSSKG